VIALLIGVCLGCAIAMPAAVIDVERGVNIGAIAERAMVECGYSLKAFALSCGYSESSTLSRAFHGLAPLDLWHLRYAPLKWWQVFLMKLSSELIRYHFDELMGDYKMARANLREYEESRNRKVGS